MFSNFNVRACALLLCLSLASITTLHFGLGEISLPLTYGKDVKTISKSYGGQINSQFDHNNNDITLQCQLITVNKYDYCGIYISLGTDSPDQGLDFSQYDNIEIKLKYTAPLDKSKLKVIFRNYNDKYSAIDDYLSLQYNSISINPNLHEATVSLPFYAFQVDNWWIYKYQISYENSQVDLSNISFLEIMTDGMPVPGDYQITLTSAVLKGQLISETDFLKLMFVIWLVTAIVLISLQHNKMKTLSATDPLTGLHNRRGIRLWINKYLKTSVKSGSLTMYYLDIDDFKKVNDTYGHLTGDELLKSVSQLIYRQLKSLHYKQWALARLSGDEFSLLCRDIEIDEMASIAEQIFTILKEPITLGDHQIYVNVSIGIARADQDIKNFEDLMLRADSAMYYAKKGGKNQYKIFDESVSQDIFFRKQTAEKIKNAIIQDQFHLHYMPILDSRTLDIVSVEVLLRCHAQSLKGIGPDVFIPIAEEYELIKNIDLWVIEASFKQIAKEVDFITKQPLIFCINISAAELHNALFSQQLQSLLTLYHIDPSWIELEITETSLVETDQMSINTLQEIRSLGVKLALDDFGTGYTAFSQLVNYPVDCLKIDKSFIDHLDADDQTQATVVRAILAIAQSYQLKTIAEGIEDVTQYHLLAALGCDMMQGYLFAKPMPWEKLKDSLKDPEQESARKSLLFKFELPPSIATRVEEENLILNP